MYGKTAPPMPPNPATIIIDRLIEIGLVSGNGMATLPLAWGEINEWQRSTGVDLPAWEARLIRKLSETYIAEGKKAEHEACPAPWRPEGAQRDHKREANILDSILG